MSLHIEAKKEDIAKIVIMPGDPIRAKYIAENFLTDYKQINSVRNILGYTGIYKNTRVTIFSSGMGNPSMGIYSYELFDSYDVDYIIRIGSCGSYTEFTNVFDVVLTDESYSESTFALHLNNYKENTIKADSYLNKLIETTAKESNIDIQTAKIHCSDLFYREEKNTKHFYDDFGCVAVEMESFALFANANYLNKKAACILTVSDSFITNEHLSSKEKEISFNKMIGLALESSTKIVK